MKPISTKAVIKRLSVQIFFFCENDSFDLCGKGTISSKTQPFLNNMLNEGSKDCSVSQRLADTYLSVVEALAQLK